MPSKRTITSFGLLIFASCTFGTSRTVMTSAQVASVPAVANNTDADLMFVSDADGLMLQADPVTGVIEGSTWLWGGANSTAMAITPDGTDSTRVWALHADGWVVQWADGPVLTDFFAPPPFGGTVRTFCDLDHADDGDFYVSTVEDDVAQLWRRDGVTNVWMSTQIAGDACPRIAHDLYHDELHVLRGDGHTLEHRDPDTLAFQSSIILDADSGAMGDVDVFGNVAVGAGTTAGPILPWGGQGPGMRMAWTFDIDTAATNDAKIITGGAPSSVQITANADTGVAEMLIGTSNGNPTVRAVQLL